MIRLLTLMRHSAVACVSPESFPDKINMLNPLKKYNNKLSLPQLFLVHEPWKLRIFFYKLPKGECLIWGHFPLGISWINVMGFHKCHELSGKSIFCSFPISWSWVWSRELSLRVLMLEWLSSECHKKRWEVRKTAHINTGSLFLLPSSISEELLLAFGF